MKGIVYLRLKKKLVVKPNASLRLKDIAFLSGNDDVKHLLEKVFIYKVTPSDDNVSIIDVFHVIERLNNLYPEIELQTIGPTQIILNIQTARKKNPIMMVIVIWLLLFVGAAMAIMNFHYDVSMQAVQQKLYYLLTGRSSEYPLWIQIPYSLGLGIGMILFFNHLFKKRFNEEPSPLEVEMFKYQQDLDSYVTYHENELNSKNDSDTN
ncbi:stage V sporulation protein AA [Sediminibacillus massiliensis]|uniref:stage V sporulation protein AA n=1 Tax=Sediminibacillus massiliensis TaxID=1926277 RepID=UPI0009884CE1|nr:stage V sporulation protein AA [Sediminibacillus massiliensis]